MGTEVAAPVAHGTGVAAAAALRDWDRRCGRSQRPGSPLRQLTGTDFAAAGLKRTAARVSQEMPCAGDEPRGLLQEGRKDPVRGGLAEKAPCGGAEPRAPPGSSPTPRPTPTRRTAVRPEGDQRKALREGAEPRGPLRDQPCTATCPTRRAAVAPPPRRPTPLPAALHLSPPPHAFPRRPTPSAPKPRSSGPWPGPSCRMPRSRGGSRCPRPWPGRPR